MPTIPPHRYVSDVGRTQVHGSGDNFGQVLES